MTRGFFARAVGITQYAVKVPRQTFFRTDILISYKIYSTPLLRDDSYHLTIQVQRLAAFSRDQIAIPIGIFDT